MPRVQLFRAMDATAAERDNQTTGAVRILYSSFQTGPALPGYIRYALTSFARSGMPVVLLTNRRELDEESKQFLAANGIELFLTENDGFDFGMWRRFINATPEGVRNAWSRILLANDSVVYFRDTIPDFIAQAEMNDADMVSLTANPNLGFHLQSFFLYLKPRAIHELFRHLSTGASSTGYWDTIKSMEVGLSRRMVESGLKIAPLFRTSKHIDFSYEELIRQGAGFVKRRFVDGRYKHSSPTYFWKNGEARAIELDYVRLIREAGNLDPAFSLDWISDLNTHPSFRSALYRLRKFAFYAVYPGFRAIQRYRRYATPTVLMADLASIFVCVAAAATGGYFFGWRSALAGFLAMFFLILAVRRLRSRVRKRNGSSISAGQR